ncbi:uncharacterized protein LOC142167974 [Nicotiana tabacum]|uniref:Uncharacterized protein LOC142167974 n=1 Tax=Nicotiana tabacum TaxID=4097 RepID=A0AC58SIB0_TOBAC
MSWNVHGLNDGKKISTIMSLVRKWKVDVLCLQETKLEKWSSNLIQHIRGNRWVDWVELKSYATRGGIIVLWDRRQWNCIDSYQGTYIISCMLESLHKDFRWCFTGVYGPHTNPEREQHWDEIAGIRGLWSNQWVLGGDFNICRFESERLNFIRRSRAIKTFSYVIQELHIIDLPLQGAYYTWSRGVNCRVPNTLQGDSED